MSQSVKLIGVLILAVILWFVPHPAGLTDQAWHIFVAFIAAILAIIINATSILAASLIATAVVVFTKAMPAAKAYEGFSQGFVILIVVAFLISNVVVKTGLGKRIALTMIKWFGKSSLGLGYSLMATDMILAPAFPSNTARSGVLYPIALSLAMDSGSDPERGTQKRLGSYLMMLSLAGLTISSGMWVTAMAANLAGVEMAKALGVNITPLSWLLYALVPSIAGFILIPWFLFKVMSPELKATPQAPIMAKKMLAELGPMSRLEKLTALIFVLMVFCWAFTDQINKMFPNLNIERTAVALLGLAVLLIAKAFNDDDLKKQGTALTTFIWFALLYALSTGLNSSGFMSYAGKILTNYVAGMPWVWVYVILVVGYVLIHYLFVSQTAQMMALFSVFLAVGIASGVNPTLLAMMLLLATNFNSAITPQGSSANVLFAGSGYLTTSEIYWYGGLVTLLNTVLFLTVGTAWILLVYRMIA